MIIFAILYLLHYKKYSKFSLLDQTSLLKEQYYTYSDLGFYQLPIRGGDKMTISLNSGKQSLFFFIPYDPFLYICNLSIDGVPIKSHLLPRGLSIEGNDNATLTFYSSKKNNIQLQANFWIIPSTICPKYSAYVYGTNSIEVHSDLSQLCIFSPTFDSKSSKFKIESGIPFFSGYHYSLIYTTDFHTPAYVNDGNKIESHTIKTANFVSYFASKKVTNISDKNEYFTFSYKRRTKTKDVSYNQNYCFADSVYKCSSKECSFTSAFVFTDCLDYNIETIVIVGSVVGLVFAVTMLVLISCFLVKRKKNDENDTLSTVPLNNENNYLIEKDYTQKNINQQYQNEYNNPYNPMNQPQFYQQQTND